MAPTFPQDRIKDIPPLNLLDALYAQGVPKDYLRQFIGMPTPEITSFLLRDNQDRNLLDRAVNMAQGKELAQFGTAKDDYEKLSTALTNRGINLSNYTGGKDANALASWAGNHVNPQVLGNAIATALPGQNLLGGHAVSVDDKTGVTLFSNPQTTDAGTSPSTLRGIPTAGDRGVRGQTVTSAADIAAGSPQTTMAGLGQLAGKSPSTTPTSPGPGAGGAGAGGGGGPNNQPAPPSTWNDDQIKTWLKQNLGGTDAWFIDIPEVWKAMSDAVKAGKNATGVDADFMATSFYKNNTAAARSWYVKERADPAQTAADVAQQTQAIQNTAQQAGITLDPVRAQQMAQSYLRYGWTQTDLQRAIGAEWHYDPATKNQAAAVTKMKADAKNWLVPLSDQAIQTWGQGIISGMSTDANFQQYLRDSAKSLMPQLSNLIDTHAGDPNFTVKTFADPYAQHAANLLGIQSDQVDLNDPKWRRALDQVDSKTGERRIMSLSEWDSTLKTDPTYKYDSSANGVQDGLALAGSLKSSLGF